MRRGPLTLGVLLACLVAAPMAPGQSAGVGPIVAVPRLETIEQVDRTHPPSRMASQGSNYVFRTAPHAVSGDGYVIVTDLDGPAWLAPLERLAAHRRGHVLRVPDLAALADDPTARGRLAEALRAERPRFVAIAPKIESFRLNTLLAAWEVLAGLDADPQVDALPGILLARDPAGLSRLVEATIGYRAPTGPELRAFLVGQSLNPSPTGVRSVQKVGLIRDLFVAGGHDAEGLIVHAGPPPAPTLPGGGVRTVAPGPGRLLEELPAPSRAAIERSPLLVLFGHGAPGKACSIDVRAFDAVDLRGKTVLCGSCFSAAALVPDRAPPIRDLDGSAFQADAPRFALEALDRGAVVVYGHMRFNDGFPSLYPVLDALLRGATVGEAYQRQLNALIPYSGLDPKDLTLRAGDPAVQRRNLLLHVLIGDPALAPLAAASPGPAVAPSRPPSPSPAPSREAPPMPPTPGPSAAP